MSSRYIAFRQYRRLAFHNKPANLPDSIVTQDKYAHSCAYSSDKMGFGFVSSAFETAKTLFVLNLALLPYGWTLAGQALERLSIVADGSAHFEILQSLVFLFGNYVVDTLFGLPFSLYHVFVIEERHGFNKQVCLYFSFTLHIFHFIFRVFSL
jgi:STE24 endopeptidase